MRAKPIFVSTLVIKTNTLKSITYCTVVLIGMLFGLSGCQKSWTCACTKNAPSTTLTDDTKNQAVRVCSQYQGSIQVKYPTAQCAIAEN